MNINCVVCDSELKFETIRDEICPSCGIQFGLDDAAGGDLERQYRVYSEWRKAWNANHKQKLSKEQTAAVMESVNTHIS